MIWAKTAAGKRIPLDLEPVADGNLIRLDDGTVRMIAPGEEVAAFRRFKSHFATCPNAQKHRKPKEKSCD